MNHSLGPQRKGARGERERAWRRDRAAGRGGGGCSKGNAVDFSGPSTEAGGWSRGAQGSARLSTGDGRSVWYRRPPPACPQADRVGLQISLMKPLASSPQAGKGMLQKMPSYEQEIFIRFSWAHQRITICGLIVLSFCCFHWFSAFLVNDLLTWGVHLRPLITDCRCLWVVKLFNQNDYPLSGRFNLDTS